VDDLLLVAVGQRLGDVQHVPRPLGLGEAALLQHLVQLPARRELEDEVDALLVVEVAEQSQDVPMPWGGRGRERRGREEQARNEISCIHTTCVAHAPYGGGGGILSWKFCTALTTTYNPVSTLCYQHARTDFETTGPEILPDFLRNSPGCSCTTPLFGPGGAKRTLAGHQATELCHTAVRSSVEGTGTAATFSLSRGCEKTEGDKRRTQTRSVLVLLAQAGAFCLVLPSLIRALWVLVCTKGGGPLLGRGKEKWCR